MPTSPLTRPLNKKNLPKEKINEQLVAFFFPSPRRTSPIFPMEKLETQKYPAEKDERPHEGSTSAGFFPEKLELKQ